MCGCGWVCLAVSGLSFWLLSHQSTHPNNCRHQANARFHSCDKRQTKAARSEQRRQEAAARRESGGGFFFVSCLLAGFANRPSDTHKHKEQPTTKKEKKTEKLRKKRRFLLSLKISGNFHHKLTMGTNGKTLLFVLSYAVVI